MVVTFTCGIITAITFRPRMEPFHPQVSVARTESKAYVHMQSSIYEESLEVRVKRHFHRQDLQELKRLVKNLCIARWQAALAQQSLTLLRKSKKSVYADNRKSLDPQLRSLFDKHTRDAQLYEHGVKDLATTGAQTAPAIEAAFLSMRKLSESRFLRHQSPENILDRLVQKLAREDYDHWPENTVGLAALENETNETQMTEQEFAQVMSDAAWKTASSAASDKIQ